MSRATLRTTDQSLWQCGGHAAQPGSISLFRESALSRPEGSMRNYPWSGEVVRHWQHGVPAHICFVGRTTVAGDALDTRTLRIFACSSMSADVSTHSTSCGTHAQNADVGLAIDQCAGTTARQLLAVVPARSDLAVTRPWLIHREP